MSQAVATTIDEQPSRKLPQVQINGGQVRAIIPTDIDSAWRIANITFKSGMAPKDFDTAEKCMVAVMHGMEIGLPPMAAMQSIAVINGRPTVWGDAALAIVRNSGLMERITEELEVGQQGMVAICTVKRVGEEPVTRTFSEQQAKAAYLWGNDKKPIWKQYPERMLQMRARAYALRDVFPEPFKGLAIREDVQDYHEPRDVTPPAPPAPPEPPKPPVQQTQSPSVSATSEGEPAMVWEDAAQADPPTPPVPPVPPSAGNSGGSNGTVTDGKPREPTPPDQQRTTPVAAEAGQQKTASAATPTDDGIPPELDRRLLARKPTPPGPQQDDTPDELVKRLEQEFRDWRDDGDGMDEWWNDYWSPRLQDLPRAYTDRADSIYATNRRRCGLPGS